MTRAAFQQTRGRHAPAPRQSRRAACFLPPSLIDHLVTYSGLRLPGLATGRPNLDCFSIAHFALGEGLRRAGHHFHARLPEGHFRPLAQLQNELLNPVRM